MTQKVLLISAPMTEEQLEQVKGAAKEHDVVLAKEFKGSLEEIEIMYGWNKGIAEELLEADNSQLKWVQAESAGVDHIDTDKFKEKNIIWVCSFPPKTRAHCLG